MRTRQYYAGFAVFLVIFCLTFTAKGQFIRTDWEIHDVSQIIELVNNHGSLHQVPISGYPRLVNAEFPPGSNTEHHYAIGPIVAGLSEDRQDTMVTTIQIAQWNTGDEFAGYSEARWDSVYKVNRGDTIDIGDPEDPYYPEYTPHSDQDLVTRYNDYNRAALNVADHDPMFLDVYQRSWAWASAPMNQFHIFNLDFIFTEKEIKDAWFGVFFNPSVGYYPAGGEDTDDYVTYYPDHKMIIGQDADGGPDGNTETMMGVKILPPRNQANNNFDWTFRWGWEDLQFTRDGSRYEAFSNGEIQTNQVTEGNTISFHSFGPINSLGKGDTVSWRYATVYGYSEQEVLEKSRLIDRLAPDFKVPSSPPSPNVTVETSNKQVTLKWDRSAEKYDDPQRWDDAEQPFEGYRVYKSTQSVDGPWTLVSISDVKGNVFGHNIGLKHEFKDTGLLNNVEYYYTVTAISKPDTVLGFPSQESSKRVNAVTVTPGTGSREEVGEVAVVPNPYRGDVDYNSMDPPWEKPDPTRDRWLEQDRRVQFINLPGRCTIKIYTLTGKLVETLNHNDPNKGFEDWNLTSNVNQAIASGIYLFTVRNEETGNTQTGKFVIIK